MFTLDFSNLPVIRSNLLCPRWFEKAMFHQVYWTNVHVIIKGLWGVKWHDVTTQASQAHVTSVLYKGCTIRKVMAGFFLQDFVFCSFKVEISFFLFLPNGWNIFFLVGKTFICFICHKPNKDYCSNTSLFYFIQRVKGTSPTFWSI